MTTCDRCGQEHAPGAECKGDAAWGAADALELEYINDCSGSPEVLQGIIARHLRAFAAAEMDRLDSWDGLADCIDMLGEFTDKRRKAFKARASRIEAAARAVVEERDQHDLMASGEWIAVHGSDLRALSAALDSKGKEAGDAEA